MGVLDDMTKGITDRKAKAAGPKLTPVGLEASGTKPSLMPKDLPGRYMAGEEVTELARDLREKAATLVAIADSLDLYTGEASATVIDAKAAAIEAQKREEREADARVAATKAAAELPVVDLLGEEWVEREDFKERLDRISAEAVAALDEVLPQKESPFNSLPKELPSKGGWECPDHGNASLKQLESRKGRKYMACQSNGCREFEKP
jgi:hypothetical protein